MTNINIKKLLLILFISLCIFSSFGNNKSKEIEIILKTKTGDISGTLLIADTTIITPVTLIIAGSGPTDRDCNAPGMQTNAYKKLAEELANKEISSLRYDKRGIGKSKSAVTSEKDLRFETYVEDAVAWVNLLKSNKNFSKIFIIGHSEGSLIGIIAAQKVTINGFISLEGAGKSADKIILEQLSNYPQLEDEARKIIDSLLIDKPVVNISSSLQTLFRPSAQPYIISWIKYNPSEEIKKIKIPILIIQGATDIQVSIDDANLLKTSVPSAKLVIIDKMNHILKEAESDRQKNLSTYNNPDLPINKELTTEIISFIIM